MNQLRKSPSDDKQSFSAAVKEELCRFSLRKKCCAEAEAYGVLLFATAFSDRSLKIVTSGSSFYRRLPKLFQKAFGLDFDSLIPPEENKKAVLSISSKDKIAKIFETYGYEADTTLAHHINLGVLENDCCRAGFFRGAFLAGGSITDPLGRCQLELVTDHRSVSGEAFALLLEMGFSPGRVSRKGRYVLYFRKTSAIEDLLTTIGAPQASMTVMNAMAEKEIRSGVNRRVNCDSANADRIVGAAQKQLEQIREIDRKLGLRNLPEDLQEVAMLRIANPEASLTELSQLSSGLSKSGVNHRMRKLLLYFEQHPE